MATMMRFLTLAPILTILAMITPPGTALSAGEAWLDWQRADFPFRIRTITLADGTPWSTGAEHCWGKWCATLAPNAYVKRIKCGPDCRSIHIVNLKFTHPVIGASKGFISYKKLGTAPTDCVLWPHGAVHDNQFLITCPKDITVR